MTYNVNLSDDRYGDPVFETFDTKEAAYAFVNELGESIREMFLQGVLSAKREEFTDLEEQFEYLLRESADDFMEAVWKAIEVNEQEDDTEYCKSCGYDHNCNRCLMI